MVVTPKSAGGVFDHVGKPACRLRGLAALLGQLAGDDAVGEHVARLQRGLRDGEELVTAHRDHDAAEAVLEGLVRADEGDVKDGNKNGGKKEEKNLKMIRPSQMLQRNEE